MKTIKRPSLSSGTKIKEPQSYSTIDSSIDYPIFCLKHLKSSHGLEICDERERAALINKMATLSKMTWNEIKLAPKHGLGSEKIARSSIKDTLPDFITDDVQELLAFRFKGKAPFLGHRRGPVLHVIFVDPKFDLYDH